MQLFGGFSLIDPLLRGPDSRSMGWIDMLWKSYREFIKSLELLSLKRFICRMRTTCTFLATMGGLVLTGYARSHATVWRCVIPLRNDYISIFLMVFLHFLISLVFSEEQVLRVCYCPFCWGIQANFWCCSLFFHLLYKYLVHFLLFHFHLCLIFYIKWHFKNVISAA
jgi:hypothetical protein